MESYVGETRTLVLDQLAQLDISQQEAEKFTEIKVAANEKGIESDISQEEIKKYKEVGEAAKRDRVESVAKKDKTGNDPRVFSNKWMPYYRSTELSIGIGLALTGWL